MAPEQMHILRVPLSDSSEDAYVLINVTSNGFSPLDLKLLATEGTAPYIATIKPSRISKLRSKRNPLTPTDWSTTLQSFLCQKHDPTSPSLQAKDLSKLEASASLSTDDTLTLTLRHNISGILLSLGSITFTKDEAQEIDIFAWCSLSVQHSGTLSTTIQTLNEQLVEQKGTIGKLEQQLDDLIQAKKTHEEELLAKFALLLNEKKLKIREQQRLLAGAKVNPNDAKKVTGKAKELAKGRTPEASRKGKRKVDVKDEDENEDDGFEDNHRVATAGGPGVEDTDADDGEEQVETPELSDQDVTEDDDDGGDDGLDAGGKDQDAVGENQGIETHETSKPDEKMQIDSLPPSRELPFGNHDANVGAGKETTAAEADESVLNQEAGNDDDETEDEDDDEL